MEKEERREDMIPSRKGDSRIEVVVNQPGSDETVIDLVRIFRNMKRKRRVYVWVILLCFAAGLCLPLLMYQFSAPQLTVASVVTLRYDVVNRTAAGQIISSMPVSDLTAPDGGELDLNQITASNVLQAALAGLELSHPVSLADLRANIRIDRILTEESRRQQELASRMIDDKNADGYEQLQSIDLTYENRFVVSLTNGFGSPDSRVKYKLKDEELRLLLNRILEAYNDYLVALYADLKLPDDQLSAIDMERQDILESLDLLRSAMQELSDFCRSRPQSVRTYRSWRTGLSLNDLLTELEEARSVNVNYLYSYVSTNSIVRDRESMITSYRYKLRSAQGRLDTLNENIATTQDILDNYKNDEIYVSMQESDTAKSTRTTTDYYNQLIIEQANNYDKVAQLEITITDLQYKLDSLTTEAGGSESITHERVTEELASALEVCRGIYARIRDQFEEIQDSAFFTDYAAHSVAQGRTRGFLSASAKKMALGGVAGLVIACGLWFLSAFAMEFSDGKNDKFRRKGVSE